MSFSEKLNQAIQYTGTIFQRLGELILLFIVSIIPIVDFIAIGYYVRVVRDSSASREVPKLERYGDLFVEGLKVFAVAIIWALIIAVISVVIATPFVAVALIDMFANPAGVLNAGWILAFGAFFAIFAVIAFLLGIFAFMGIIHMVKQNQFGKAFAFGEIFGMIGKIGWLRYMAYFVVLFIVSAILSAITGALGPIGWIVGALLSVLVGLVFARTIGLMYDQAVGVTPAVAPAMSA